MSDSVDQDSGHGCSAFCLEVSPGCSQAPGAGTLLSSPGWWQKSDPQGLNSLLAVPYRMAPHRAAYSVKASKARLRWPDAVTVTGDCHGVMSISTSPHTFFWFEANSVFNPGRDYTGCRCAQTGPGVTYSLPAIFSY